MPRRSGNHSIRYPLTAILLALSVYQILPAQADRGRRGYDDDSHHNYSDNADIFKQVEADLIAQGFQILKLEYSDGMIEAKGYEANGRCVEVYFNRTSGEELFRELEDNCSRYTEKRLR